MFNLKSPITVVDICSANYNFWKEKALKENDPIERKKAMEKAFFWLEAQSSMLTLWAIENIHKDNPEMLKKVEKARTQLNKKLLEYAENILKELK